MSNIIVIYILLDNKWEYILQNAINVIRAINYIVIRDTRNYYDVFFEYIYENYNKLLYDKYVFCLIDDDFNDDIITYINTHIFSDSVFLCNLCDMQDLSEYKEISNVQFECTMCSLFSNYQNDINMCNKMAEDGSNYYSKDYFVKIYNMLFDDFDEELRFISADGNIFYISKNAILSRTLDFYKKIIDIVGLSDRNKYYIQYFIEKIFTGKYIEWKTICKKPPSPEIKPVIIREIITDPNIINYVDNTLRIHI